MKAKRKILFWVSIFCLVSLFPGLGRAAEYTITHSVDFTGPYAVIMKPIDQATKVFYAWWNETVGSKLGIKLNFKQYETRYDPSVVASLWPGILAGDKPIAHAGLGGPDVAALMKRLPEDKVPMFMGTAAYGYEWSANQWIFHFRPTYIHETVSFLNWARKELIKTRPIRVGYISSKASPAYVEGYTGLKKFSEENKWTECLEAEWVDVKPVSITNEMRRLARKNPDFISIMSNTAHVLSCVRAQKELGIHIPILMSSHNGIQMCTLAAGDMKILEGHYEVEACDPGIDPNVPGARIYEEYIKKLEIETRWSMIAAQASAAFVLVFRAVERAAAKVGPNNITGETLYQAMYERPFTLEETLGLTNKLVFSKEAPFPLNELKARISIVKDGKQVLTPKDWVPVVSVPKW
jgi:branched-chain amino acid transport system substrate-binding protein